LFKRLRDVAFEFLKASAKALRILFGHALLHELFLDGFSCLAYSATQSEVHPEKAKGH